jgi:hypothetical protein
MNNRLILAASLALAFAAPAFAQDSTQPASPADDQAAPTDTQPASSDTQQPPAKPRHRHVTHQQGMAGPNGYNPAAERLTGNEPGVAAYQASDGDKYRNYPPVDHGHVHGDPPVIDHSGDHVTVPPTTTTITVPPTH